MACSESAADDSADRDEPHVDRYAADLLPRVTHVGFDGSPAPEQDDLDQYEAEQMWFDEYAELGGEQ